MAIPRFTAIINQVQVPSMKNYQEEQNESIAKSLADFGSSLLFGAEKLFIHQEQKKKEQIDELLKQRGNLISNKADASLIAEIDERIKALGGSV